MGQPSSIMVPFQFCFAFWVCRSSEMKLLADLKIVLDADQIYCPNLLLCGGKKDRKKRGNNKNWKKKTQKARIWFQSHFTSYARVVHSEGSYILVFFYLACGLTEV